MSLVISDYILPAIAVIGLVLSWLAIRAQMNSNKEQQKRWEEEQKIANKQREEEQRNYEKQQDLARAEKFASLETNIEKAISKNALYTTQALDEKRQYIDNQIAIIKSDVRELAVGNTEISKRVMALEDKMERISAFLEQVIRLDERLKNTVSGMESLSATVQSLSERQDILLNTLSLNIPSNNNHYPSRRKKSP